MREKNIVFVIYNCIFIYDPYFRQEIRFMNKETKIRVTDCIEYRMYNNERTLIQVQIFAIKQNLYCNNIEHACMYISRFQYSTRQVY